MKRIIAGLLATVLGANGVVMLAAGGWWYGAVPGVTMTGPYNPHFVKDIGAAYLVVAGGLAWRALRPGQGRAPSSPGRPSSACTPSSMWPTPPWAAT